MIASHQTRILIVEDSNLMRVILSSLLEQSAYGDVVAVMTIRDAMIELGLEARDSGLLETESFQLILMDKELPDGDGIDAIKRIRAHGSTKDIPIIMVTTSGNRETLQQALDAGATDFLTKNFNETELLARVRAALRLDHALRAMKARQEELWQLTHTLERLSLTDGLTQIANRRHFDTALESAWQTARRETECLSVAVMDVDFFKKYNDNLGHQAGDECLKIIASTLHNALRRPKDLIARYGGEEFAAILVNTNATGANQMAERLRLAIHQAQIPHPDSSISATVSLSVGVATIIPNDTLEDFETLFKMADAALYEAKRTGRNRVFHHQDLEKVN